MKKIFLLISIFVISLQIYAQEKNKNAKYTIKVKGNCRMCQKRIEKASLNSKGVKYAKWNKNTKQLTLIMNEEKIDIKTVQKNISKVGHDTESIKAPKEVYNNLHTCCQYRD